MLNVTCTRKSVVPPTEFEDSEMMPHRSHFVEDVHTSFEPRNFFFAQLAADTIESALPTKNGPWIAFAPAVATKAVQSIDGVVLDLREIVVFGSEG